MDLTRHDLSFDSTALDFEALLKTAQIAFVESRESLGEHIAKHCYEDQPSSIYLEHIAQTAKNLAIAGETMAALTAAKTRNKIAIINKPKVE